MITRNLIEDIIHLTLRVKQEEIDARDLSNYSIEELEEERRMLLVQVTPEWYEFD